VEVIETKDPHEAQRCRRAQYSGLPTTITLNGSTIRGVVRSVKEEPGALWIVSIITKEQKDFAFPRHRPSYNG
jgi:hypothetical protein